MASLLTTLLALGGGVVWWDVQAGYLALGVPGFGLIVLGATILAHEAFTNEDKIPRGTQSGQFAILIGLLLQFFSLLFWRQRL